VPAYAPSLVALRADATDIAPPGLTLADLLDRARLTSALVAERAPDYSQREMAKLSSLDSILLAAYATVVGAISVASSVRLIRFGERDQLAPVADAIGREWLAEWAITSSLILLGTAALGGLIVLGSRTPWEIVFGCAFASGLIVGASAYLTFLAMGQFEPGSPSCGIGEENCTISLGFGAGLLSVVAALGLGATFLATHMLRRAAGRVLSLR
jgi:hypothetical protein